MGVTEGQANGHDGQTGKLVDLASEIAFFYCLTTPAPLPFKADLASGLGLDHLALGLYGRISPLNI